MGLRGWLYLIARLMGDVNAISRGPGAMGRRAGRKAVGRAAGSINGRLFK